MSGREGAEIVKYIKYAFDFNYDACDVTYYQLVLIFGLVIVLEIRR